MLDTIIGQISEDRPTTIDGQQRIVAPIGFGGDHTGNCLIACSHQLACKVASIMLMQEYPAVNEDVMDTFGEISHLVLPNNLGAAGQNAYNSQHPPDATGLVQIQI